MSTKRIALAAAVSSALGLAVAAWQHDTQQPDTSMPNGTACGLKKPTDLAAEGVCDRPRQASPPTPGHESWSRPLPANAASALVAALEMNPTVDKEYVPGAANDPLGEMKSFSSDLRKALAQNGAAIRECFEAWKKLDPALPTAVEVEFLLEADGARGRITHVEATQKGGGNMAFGGCIRSVVADVAIDAPPMDKVRVRYPITMALQ
jgi:hypothetical protein